MSFYFIGRFQIKSQEYHRSLARSSAMVPQVVENIRRIRALRHDSPGVADTDTDAELTVAAIEPEDNPALRAWQENGHD
jgi:hypothetical protein